MTTDRTIYIGTKRGEQGYVWRDGLLLGRVFTKSRVAAGTGGEFRRFFTATPLYPGCEPGAGGSLGTRFETRAEGVQALLDFHEANPAARYAAQRPGDDWNAYRTVLAARENFRAGLDKAA